MISTTITHPRGVACYVESPVGTLLVAKWTHDNIASDFLTTYFFTVEETQDILNERDDYIINIKKLMMSLNLSDDKNSPPFIVIVCQESINETNCPNYSSEEQHLSVETQPCKINTYLFSIIFPVES